MITGKRATPIPPSGILVRVRSAVLRERRLELGLELTVAARRACLSGGHLWHLENKAEATARTATLKRLARVLKCSAEALHDGPPPTKPLPVSTRMAAAERDAIRRIMAMGLSDRGAQVAQWRRLTGRDERTFSRRWSQAEREDALPKPDTWEGRGRLT